MNQQDILNLKKLIAQVLYSCMTDHEYDRLPKQAEEELNNIVRAIRANFVMKPK